MIPTELVTSALVSLVMPFLLEGIKWSRVPLLNLHTPRLNRAMAGVAAAITAMGVTSTYDHETGTLMVTGLTIESVVRAGAALVVNVLVQQATYRAAIDPKDGER